MKSPTITETASLPGRIAVVTGASSGIGRAIACELSKHKVQLCVAGRDPTALAYTAAAVRRHAKVAAFDFDLTVEDGLHPLVQHVRRVGRLDFLIHCAGIIQESTLESARIDDLDLQYKVNVRAPYLLTQRLLPMLIAAKGQIVFLNSTVGLDVKRANLGQYAATKHALKAIADSLREELNPRGIRVLSFYLGRTATPMQESLFRKAKKPYRPESLMQPRDVASVIVRALMLPPTIELTDVSMRPAAKTY